MPNVVCPFKNDPGYVTARRCTAPCGGWVLLYDVRKGFPVAVPEAVGRYRYVLVHRDSWNWAAVETRKVAMRILVATAKGEDVHGILPATVPPEDGPLGGVRKPEPPAAGGGGNAPSAGSDSPEARARARESEDVPDEVLFQRAINERFGPGRLADEVELGLTAVKTYQTKEGDVLEFPDYSTRVKYLDLLFKYRIGIPEKRAKPKEARKFTMADLEQQIAVSPAARRWLLDKIAAAGEAAKVPAPAGEGPGA